MKKKIAISALLMIFVLIFFVSCVSRRSVTFNASVPDVQVYIDGKFIGTTPCTAILSTAGWIENHVIAMKDGYVTIDKQIDREILPVNIIGGFFLFGIPWFYADAPKPNQFLILYPSKVSIE